jgi:hypothetical protein
LYVFACFGQTADKGPQPRQLQPTLDEVLSWLPGDTETIIAANGPFPVPDFDASSADKSLQRELTLRELALRTKMFALGLYALKNGGLKSFLHGYTVAIAVEGSRSFRPPADLGEMLYEGCAIVVLNNITLDADSFMKSAVNTAKRFEQFEGAPIAVFEEAHENDIWTTFVGFPRNNVVLVATDGAYLRTVLARMRGIGGPRALPATLPEWKYVDTRKPAWGVRHYQRREVTLDPTSPYQGKAAANIPDNDAVGVAFWFEPVGRRLARVIYLSANSGARQILQDHFDFGLADSAFRLHVHGRASGVIEGSVTLSRVEAFSHLFFGLTAMLGHAIYL